MGEWLWRNSDSLEDGAFALKQPKLSAVAALPAAPSFLLLSCHTYAVSVKATIPDPHHPLRVCLSRSSLYELPPPP
ncbi:unnamed protein product [Arctogadus glacialis]